ncbi:hypothetical protein BST81_01935 [Leptolyngbya sp. 'hensonii']|uniref:hypothetical protein n=1 Tax=Leptolyngbya sp. 'hensonii' TaxID=1922337 RepID=UPI00094FF5BB|nr:hypothetical protein [Leptolyngbya sp. 'hensonii']OLP20213.1 hypothetical protein BST81_01935 [Leptolyngbya sp. 'hensonii']
MVGFIKGFWGSNNQNEASQGQSSGSYFLNADEAKTMGNVDYMRTAKTVRRTFPSSKGEIEIIEQISAVEKKQGTEFSAPSESAPETPVSIKDERVAERRQTDTSMDMFRNMARSIKK